MAVLTDEPARHTVLVRLPGEPTFADLLVVDCVKQQAKDLIFVFDPGQSTAERISAVLCVGVLPRADDPSPVLLRGAPVTGEERLDGAAICSDAERNISSSAGYAAGIQLVGSFFPPPQRSKEKEGTLDLTSAGFLPLEWRTADLVAILAKAEEIVTYPRSPIVTVGLALGARLRIVDGPASGWPVRAEHLALARKQADRVWISTGQVPRGETGAAPRVSRLLRQAAYLGL